MPRLTRQPVVALLAALAALLAPLGAAPAGSVAGATQTTSPTSHVPPGRVTAGRELRDVSVRRSQHGSGAELSRTAWTGSERAGAGPVAALAVVALLVAAAWWVRRDAVGRALVGRTSGIRCGRGPPVLASA
jgi:hypothetical protein